jgi:hypothetical protein
MYPPVCIDIAIKLMLLKHIFKTNLVSHQGSLVGSFINLNHYASYTKEIDLIGSGGVFIA